MAEILREEERLDELDPLRHLRDNDADAAGNTDEGISDGFIVPAQRPSIINQLQILSFPVLVPELRLSVDASPGCGGIAWPAGEVLSRYICLRETREPGWMKTRTVLELGAGTGLVGLVAAKLGAKHVVITDQTPLLPLIERNIVLNNVQNACIAAEFNWGEPLSEAIRTGAFDLILAADCVYLEPAFPLLVQSLCDLTNESPRAELLFCYKKRRKADKRFFVLLKKHFEWEEVDDDPERPVYSRDTISLLRFRRRGVKASF
ncbi:S-adenosyl-L-methionine-dependent methyltransferase [Dacryopinax primogenitus]|uniref:Protein-lysine N-methyltransferase EFM6 n=1 Tax=Dacryopinax primogenitus (strain DJM 731) TaxID=1858805 RepID=M5FRR8_DACPD|nr:S-adenosyl-L-methionine-dependent methyltransferase [Dacryopinax primogenitus]EJT97714.1 S-adenosyl-L-methionine-dependent methyltransferase [Dacryopinax primogenitus]